MSYAPTLLPPATPGQIAGLVLAEVVAIHDDGYEIRLRSTTFSETLRRARVATLMAGNQRGVFFQPEVDDEVVVGFEMGDLSRPIILGALWSDRDPPPATADTSSSNNLRTIVSRAGHQITFDDSSQPKITIVSSGGLEITIQDAPTQKITIKSTGAVATSKIELDGVAWNHQHATGTGPSGPPVSITPVP